MIYLYSNSTYTINQNSRSQSKIDLRIKLCKDKVYLLLKYEMLTGGNSCVPG